MALNGPAPPPATWRDGKKYLWLLGLFVPAFPFLAWALAEATGQGVFWWSELLLLYATFPWIDHALGKDPGNPPDAVLAWLEQQRYYRWCTYLYLPLQYAGLVMACYLWSRGGLSTVDKLGLAFTTGFVGGNGINAAHELGHKKDALERWLSKVALAQTAYGHFFIEHNRGHHVRVATPRDPASARLGETYWRFWPRTVLGSLRSAWGLEARRLARTGRRPWTARNDVLNAWAMTLVLYGVLVTLFGPGILPYLLLQAVVGFSLLETINYIEHYGLLRQRTAGGRLERCAPRHSWNCNNLASNVLLYHLQRHSDHHANPTRRYQALRHVDEAPELPAGYPTMTLLAWIPPLWRRVMDGRVLAHYGGDVDLANVQAGHRGRYRS
ncbi:alkane 1-monooxygenase [Actinomadura oligospora]|uniref:alkane 1-monooxygenase n=1 Tax=Actinomadura oligospora TaxID=111804 RepID=UPI0004B284D0|nr:alkane 1-monooxygenase [Actinomadura oligospora]